MIKWMGFNYGIGFHALQSNSYYRYLGVKRSSHGCLRISRETAEELYSTLELGTPILVYDGDKAVEIAFGDSSTAYDFLSYDEIRTSLTERYTSLYEGSYFQKARPRLLIDRTNVKHPGLPVGKGKKIAARQIIKPLSVFVALSSLEPKEPVIIHKEYFTSEELLKRVSLVEPIVLTVYDVLDD